MYIKIILSLLIIAHAKAGDVVLPYNEVAYTTSGAPCIGGCSPKTHQCVASWPPKNEPCVSHSTPAPRFLTNNNKQCLSNCGPFAWNTPWCYVTSDGQYDDCNPRAQQQQQAAVVLPYNEVAYTTSGAPCIGGCSPETHQCVASWPPKNEPCVSHSTPAPRFLTNNNKQCLSNCGPFAWSTPWCYVTSDGQYDDCNPQAQQQQQVAVVLPTLVLPYNEVAYTTSGAPCIGGCSPETHQCVASWPPKNEPCVSHSTPAPRFLTNSNKQCLSNCGPFAWNTPWCYVTSDGQYEYCNSQAQQQQATVVLVPVVLPYNEVAFTTSGAPCIGGCSSETHQCVASWPPKNEPCVSHSTPAPKFLTNNNKQCLSNCGPFAWNTPWCYVTSDGQYEYCNSQAQQQQATVVLATVVLPYNEVAFTTSGAPCIGGCSSETHQCVASWPPKNELCLRHPTPAPRFLTTQAITKHKHCLSNCGPFAWSTPWCYVTSDGQYDYCNPQEQQQQKQQQHQQTQQPQQPQQPQPPQQPPQQQQKQRQQQATANLNSNDLILPYEEVAYTMSGAPCIGGCSRETNQCVASWPPKNEPCVRHPIPAPKFLTTQAITKQTHCLSNCGYYDWDTAWCFVTSDGQWDNCTPQEQQVIANDLVLPYTIVAYTTTGKPCIGGCSPDTHQCVASWPPKNQPCVLYNVPAPTYNTTQKYTNYTNCLSNCGPFSWNNHWCYVTSDGQWDYCNLQEQEQQQQHQQQQQQQQATANLNSKDGILPYYEVAYATSGAPCIGGCSPETNQCVASWPPKNEPCVSHNTLSPRFSTTQRYTKHKYCLSNCGTFLGYAEPWCYVTYDGILDTCTPVQNQHLTTQQVTTVKSW